MPSLHAELATVSFTFEVSLKEQFNENVLLVAAFPGSEERERRDVWEGIVSNVVIQNTPTPLSSTGPKPKVTTAPVYQIAASPDSLTVF